MKVTYDDVMSIPRVSRDTTRKDVIRNRLQNFGPNDQTIVSARVQFKNVIVLIPNSS